jgi:hypothetical protein
MNCVSGMTQWAEQNFDKLHVTVEAESERLNEILAQIQNIQTLPTPQRQRKLKQLVDALEHAASKEEVQQLIDTLDESLSEFLSDPRRFVACIGQILGCLEVNSEKTQIALQRFIQDKQIGENSTPAPFDWTTVDILLSQLSHLAGPTALFTIEMRDSVILSLFPQNCDGHFLQDLVSQFLLLSVGEQIGTVRARMQALSHAPLSKVTQLSNMLIEIQEKYAKEKAEICMQTGEITN